MNGRFSKKIFTAAIIGRVIYWTPSGPPFPSLGRGIPPNESHQPNFSLALPNVAELKNYEMNY